MVYLLYYVKSFVFVFLSLVSNTKYLFAIYDQPGSWDALTTTSDNSSTTSAYIIDIVI